MKKWIVGVFVCLMSCPAWAGDLPVNAKFYDFGDQFIDGMAKGPSVTLVEGDKKIEHTRLLQLKKSFMESIQETAKDPVLK